MRTYFAQHNRILTIIVLAIGVIALLVLSMTLVSAEFVGGSLPEMIFNPTLLTGDTGGGGLRISGPVTLLFNLIVLFLILAVIYASIRDPVAAIRLFVISVIVLFGTRMFLPLIGDTPPVTPTETAAEEEIVEPVPVPEQSGDGFEILDPPAWFSAGLIATVSLVVGGGLAALAWGYFRPQTDASLTLNQQIGEDAQQAIDHIVTGYDLRAAILNAWYQMSATLQREQGIVRNNDMTAREFEQKLVTNGFPEQAVTRLTRLFEQVRYSESEPGVREQREAIDCLSVIVAAAKPEEQPYLVTDRPQVVTDV